MITDAMGKISKTVQRYNINDNAIVTIVTSTKAQYELFTTAILTSFNTQWQIQSSSSIGAFYTVSLDDQQCQYSLQCLHCNICIYTYSCTCPDALINASICNHILFVMLQQTLVTTPPPPLSTTTTGVGPDTQYYPTFKTEILTKTNSVHSYYLTPTI